MLLRLTALSCLLLTTPLLAQDTKQELKPFQGHWQVVELVEDGKVIPEKAIQNWLPSGGRVEIAENAIIFKSPGNGEKQVKLFTVDATTYPKGIEVSTKERKTGVGIYQFDNNKLVICLGDPAESEKPKEFAASEGSKHVMMVLKQSASREPAKTGTIKSRPETASKPEPVKTAETGAKVLTDAEVTKKLIGNWKLTDNVGALYVTFNPNGTFSTVREYTEIRLFQKALVQTPFTSGTWSVQNGSVTAHITSSVRPERVNMVISFVIRSITDRDMIMVDQLGRIDSAIRLP